MVLPSARMADSTRPELIPDAFAMRGNGVLAYYDGLYAWTPEELERFPNRWHITVTGNLAVAPYARAIDVENFDATPQEVPPYRDARAARGMSTYVYANRSTVPAVVDTCGGEDHLRWIIATLDNNHWTPVTIVNSIRAETGFTIDAARIAAIQCYDYGTYDKSLVYGPPDWSSSG
jgi:hypothetical protein